MSFSQDGAFIGAITDGDTNMIMIFDSNDGTLKTSR